MCAQVLVGLITFHQKDANTIDEVWQNTVGTVVSDLRPHDITGLGLKWDDADGFLQQCNPLLVACVGGCLEKAIVAPDSYHS